MKLSNGCIKFVCCAVDEDLWVKYICWNKMYEEVAAAFYFTFFEDCLLSVSGYPEHWTIQP